MFERKYIEAARKASADAAAKIRGEGSDSNALQSSTRFRAVTWIVALAAAIVGYWLAKGAHI
jgi:hypothetical protein